VSEPLHLPSYAPPGSPEVAQVLRRLRTVHFPDLGQQGDCEDDAPHKATDGVDVLEPSSAAPMPGPCPSALLSLCRRRISFQEASCRPLRDVLHWRRLAEGEWPQLLPSAVASGTRPCQPRPGSARSSVASEGGHDMWSRQAQHSMHQPQKPLPPLLLPPAGAAVQRALN